MKIDKEDIARIARRLSMYIDGDGTVRQTPGRAIPWELWIDVFEDEFDQKRDRRQPIDKRLAPHLGTVDTQRLGERRDA